MQSHKAIHFILILILAISASACNAVAKDYEPFDAGSFKDSTNITNQWMPLKPGMQLIYEGFTNNDNGERVPRHLVVTITDLTKMIGDVRSAVSFDQDFNADQLVEAELAFYAQDDHGTVWRMGEHPEEFENGKFVTAPTWIHGVAEANAGIEMLAEPKLGTRSYSQGWAPAVEFTDRAQVSQTGQKVCVPLTCYENVIVIDETSKAEPDAHQLKYFASGVGNIKVDWKGADQTQETLELIQVVQLSPDEVAQVRTAALDLEKHAYEVSQIYAKTSPLQLPDGTTVNVAPTPGPTQVSGAASDEIVIYASDLSQSNLSELDFYDDPASPGGKLIGLPNNGDELDAPPENDPHVTFSVSVQSGIPYRCWIHMKVGAPKGVSQANVIWVQISDALDPDNKEILKPGSASYLTAEGPTSEGWAWVECDRADSDVDSLIHFGISGEVTVRLQAGAEGVGFDQFILSPEKFLNAPPTAPIVEK